MATKAKTQVKASSGEKKSRGPRADSKLSKCQKLYQDNKTLPRKQILAMFKKVGVTDKALGTYYYLIQKRLKG